MMQANCAKCCILLMCIIFSAASVENTFDSTLQSVDPSSHTSETTNSSSSENCGHRAGWRVYMEVAAEMIAKAKNIPITCHGTDSTCGWKEALKSYLDVADGMINKGQIDFLTGANCNNSVQQPIMMESNIHQQVMGQQVIDQQVRDCSDLLRMGNRRSGIYTIYPLNRMTVNKNISVYCDMETDGGGWTVIQRRGEYGNPIDFFNKDWKNYKEGFGDLEKEFWLGNNNIHAITYQRYYSVRIDLVDMMNNTRYAKYDNFWIADEAHKYALHISNYSGDAGDSMAIHNNMKFSASDQDNDLRGYHCAQVFKGGWWYNACFDASLNAEKLRTHRTYYGLIWKAWKGYGETLDRVVIMIRPKDFKPK